MKTIKRLYLGILAGILVLAACNQSNYKNEQNDLTKINFEDTIKINPGPQKDTTWRILVKDPSVKITFPELEIFFDSLYIWNEGNLSGIDNDTCRIYLELGETIENRMLQIKSKDNIKLKFYQRYENSITVMNEGPHCDLTEWKHFDSPYHELKINGNRLKTVEFSSADREKFVKVDMKELLAYIKDYCGKEWSDIARQAKSIRQYPFGIGQSRIFLKIEIIHSDNSKTERIISFEIPMGC
jgi:hypothetical protein